MTIQNLNPWSTLYLSESKYNLLVKPALWSAICWPLYLVLMIAVLMLYRIAPVISVISVMLLSFGYGWLYWHDRTASNSSSLSSIAISSHGEVIINQKWHYQLVANSRVGWFGCWLVLQSQADGLAQKTLTRFFAKQQFSPRDYARLTRCVLRNRIEAPSVKPEPAIK